MRPQPPQVEAVLAWALWAIMALAVLTTYARVPSAELYHVSHEGFAGGASRTLVLLNFPIALAAIALVLASLAALPAGFWWAGAPAIALCAVTAWPGVVDQADLDARPINVLPALGVALALALTSLAAKLAGAGIASRRPGDVIRLVVAVVVVAAALPWWAAELGFHLPGDVFLGEELDAEGLAAVHLGHHHGTDGALLVLTGLVLSRVRMRGRRGVVYTAYVSVMLAYGVVNAAQDLWTEQVWKRGWTEARFPSALEPRIAPVWLVILLLAGAAYAAISVERRRKARR